MHDDEDKESFPLRVGDADPCDLLLYAERKNCGASTSISNWQGRPWPT